MARQKQRSDTTRHKLLNAFRAAFLARGYEKTTMQQILAETGLSKGALYHHFHSKAEIIEALYARESRQAIEQALQAVDPEAPPLLRLRQACSAWTRQVQHRDTAKLLFEIGPSALGTHKAKQIEDGISLKHIESLLDEAILAGQVAAFDPKLLAAMLNALVAEAALYHVRTGADIAAMLDRAIESVIEGLPT